jgi:hypothetical protein
MKNKIILVVIIIIGLISNIVPQSLFRSGIFLHHSTGGCIWSSPDNLGTTSIPLEMTAYNISHNYTGNDAVTMIGTGSETWFPLGAVGNEWELWHRIFDGYTGDGDIQPYLNDNKIIVIKSCYPSSLLTGVGSAADTLTPELKTIYNYKWHWRSIIRVMQQHPDNFFAIWTNAPYRGGNGELSHQFCKWAKDTLATGNDPIFGDFPDNVYVFDFFHKLASPPNWWLPDSLSYWNGSGFESHPNGRATDLVAPQFVQEIFDATIAYGSAPIIKSNVNTRIFLSGPFSGGSMLTTLNTNNFITDDQPYNISPWNYNGSEFVTPGFLSTHPDIVDWVLLELRTGTESTTIVGRRAAFLKSDGSIVDIDGTSQVNFEYLIEGNYYLVIRHRNHLAVMSANLISLSSTSSQLYDFSIAQTQAYGTNAMKDLGGGYYGTYVADGNKDGGIYGEDYILYQTSQGEEGYRIEDYNLDGGVYGEDYILYQINQGFETWVP